MAAVASPATRTRVSELITPFALIDARQLRRNIADMQETAAGLGAALRPHFKTHRTPAIAALQLEAGAIGLTVATPAQLAEVTREFECPVLVSSLLQSDPAGAAALAEAHAGGRVMFAIESERSIELLRHALGPKAVPEVMIEVDAGCRRTGVDASECSELAGLAARAGCEVVGLFSYPGHSYLPGQSAAAAEQEQAALELGARELARAGFAPRHVSAGSTPTMPFARAGVVTEYRPGTYVFGDRQQLTLGAVQRSQLTLTVVATVVSVRSDCLVLDAGGKTLGRDAPRWLEGYGQLLDSDALITRLYDHHAVIEAYSGPALRVGDRVRVLPNNANSAMSLLRRAWLTHDGELAEELAPIPDR